MLQCDFFYNELLENGLDFFTGVPDSLLKNLCAYISDHSPAGSHIIAANEGNAVGMAIGHYLATGTPSVVYMQNSGQGNAVNPLLSLADPDVYGIPMLLLVGWRGEPGVNDEPQHLKQGKVTQALFDAMGIPCFVLPLDEADAVQAVRASIEKTKQLNQPVALLVRKETFAPYTLQQMTGQQFPMTREMALGCVAGALSSDAVVVSTTGMASRELYEYRESQGEGHSRDFLTVGGMGHASQIALGIALEKKDRPVVCIDGDGAALMHLGGMGILANQHVANYKHIVLNNGVHGSVGGQPTIGFDVDFCAVANAVGYKQSIKVESQEELKSALPKFLEADGPSLLEICVSTGFRSDLGRPQSTPAENKESLMAFING